MQHKLIFIVLFALLVSIVDPPAVRAQIDTTGAPIRTADTTGIDGARLAIVIGGLASAIAAVHIYQSQGWWNDNRSSFHFREDLSYGLSVDKLGHFYGAIAGAFIVRKSFLWTNMPYVEALWWGSATALMFQTYIEIEDGFSTWGFDRVDFAANVAGVAYPVAQHYWPFLRSFNMKFSYHPSSLIDEPGGIGFRGQKHTVFDDYEGQTLWLSVDVNTLLPKSVDRYWPDWLCLALGYGARDIATPDPYPVYYLALDFDVTRIIPQTTPFLRTLSETLNFIHLPAPAVRISPGIIWYGLYF